MDHQYNAIIAFDACGTLINNGHSKEIDDIYNDVKSEPELLKKIKITEQKYVGIPMDDLLKELSKTSKIGEMYELPSKIALLNPNVLVSVFSYYPHIINNDKLKKYLPELEFDNGKFLGFKRGGILEKGKSGVIKELQDQYGVLPSDTAVIGDSISEAFLRKDGVTRQFIAYNPQGLRKQEVINLADSVCYSADDVEKSINDWLNSLGQ